VLEFSPRCSIIDNVMVRIFICKLCRILTQHARNMPARRLLIEDADLDACAIAVVKRYNAIINAARCIQIVKRIQLSKDSSWMQTDDDVRRSPL